MQCAWAVACGFYNGNSTAAELDILYIDRDLLSYYCLPGLVASASKRTRKWMKENTQKEKNKKTRLGGKVLNTGGKKLLFSGGSRRNRSWCCSPDFVRRIRNTLLEVIA